MTKVYNETKKQYEKGKITVEQVAARITALRKQTVLRRKCGFRITPHIEHEVLYLLNCLAKNPERIVTPQIHRAHSQRLDVLKSELEGLIGQLPVKGTNLLPEKR